MQIRECGGAAAKNIGVHPRNDFYLLEALKRAMGGMTLSVTEAADARGAGTVPLEVNANG